jgi:hypothetical protein
MDIVYSILPLPEPVGRWLAKFIYDYQSLIAGVLAFGIAWYALRPIYRQLHIAQLQMAISEREVLITRLAEVERRSQGVAKELTTITSDFSQQLYSHDEQDEPNITSEWAHGAEQIVSQVISGLKRQQITKADDPVFDDRRAAVIAAADVLEDCLRDIHQVDSIDLDDQEYGFTVAQIADEKAKLERASEVAQSALTACIRDVSEARDELDAEYNRALAALRDRIRQINELLLKDTRRVGQ